MGENVAGSPAAGSTWFRKQLNSSQESPEESWPDLLMNRKSIQERTVWRNINPVAVERNNLVAISQLVVKNLLDSSLRSRLDSEESVPLHQFFVLLHMLFKHGLKTGRRLMYGSRDVWDVLQEVEKLDPSAGGISSSVREMNIKTSSGKAKAWYRLALMQKTLAEYFKVLLDHREVLEEYYYPEALLCSEEAVLVSGLLVSLNIIDFNLCIKDEDFDSQNNVIDLSMYLRRKEDIGRVGSQDEEAEVPASQLQTIVDQKSYVEEVNRNLVTSITNLQAKVERLTTTNLLMKEDLDISTRKLQGALKENEVLQEQVDQAAAEAQRQKMREMEISVSSLDPSQESELEQRLGLEQARLRQVEKELSLEVQMKAECEIAMKLMEKDMHMKQDTIVSLRAQLEDIKAINLEMYTKLSECKKTIEVKTDIIQKLESKSICLLETLQKLDDKFVEAERGRSAASLQLRLAEDGRKERTARVEELQQDLKIEREWRERLQETSLVDREALSKLRQDNSFLKQVSNDYENMRQENQRLKEQNREYDRTLEELGQQLSWNKLQLDSLKEESRGSTSWEKDADATACKICDKEFSIARRKHHCRNCGGIFCDKCSDNKMELPSSAKKLRVCDNCYVLLLERQSKI